MTLLNLGATATLLSQHDKAIEWYTMVGSHTPWSHDLHMDHPRDTI